MDDKRYELVEIPEKPILLSDGRILYEDAPGREMNAFNYRFDARRKPNRLIFCFEHGIPEMSGTYYRSLLRQVEWDLKIAQLPLSLMEAEIYISDKTGQYQVHFDTAKNEIKVLAA